MDARTADPAQHRHVALVMLAYAMMAAFCYHANSTITPKKRSPGQEGTHLIGVDFEQSIYRKFCTEDMMIFDIIFMIS